MHINHMWPRVINDSSLLFTCATTYQITFDWFFIQSGLCVAGGNWNRGQVSLLQPPRDGSNGVHFGQWWIPHSSRKRDLLSMHHWKCKLPLNCKNSIRYKMYSLQSLEPPQYVFWYHNGILINYERVSRVSVQTDPGKLSNGENKGRFVNLWRLFFRPKDPLTVNNQWRHQRRFWQLHLLSTKHRVIIHWRLCFPW